MADFTLLQWFTVVWFAFRIVILPAMTCGVYLSRDDVTAAQKRRLAVFGLERLTEIALLGCLIVGGFYA